MSFEFVSQILPHAASLASLLLGLSVSLLAWWVLGLMAKKRIDSGQRYEQERRGRMRRRDSLYRCFEPAIDELAQFFPDSSPTHASHLEQGRFQRALLLSESRDWKPSEFWAGKLIEACLVGGAVACLVSTTGRLGFAAVLGGLLAVGYPWMAAQSLVAQAERRLKLQRLRLPFVVDQIALMMQAGAGFEESLRTVVADEPEHPLLQELAIVLNDVDAGRSRRQALEEWKVRMRDADVAELVFAINKGEELGTPLSAILMEQAEQMRLKRSQWGEKAAAEAEVQMVFPGMLIMIACLIVIIAPILLPAAFSILGGN